jgi:hypothetical protein
MYTEAPKWYTGVPRPVVHPLYGYLCKVELIVLLLFPRQRVSMGIRGDYFDYASMPGLIHFRNPDRYAFDVQERSSQLARHALRVSRRRSSALTNPSEGQADHPRDRWVIALVAMRTPSILD